MTFCEMALRFAFYSFCGWAFECLYCPFLDGKIANRGFLRGPYCPVYGLAAVAVIYLLEPVGNPIAIFFLGAALIGSIEYFTGWLLETCFHARWWDYSEMPFNIKGRVFLLGLAVFGAMSVVGVKVFEPAFEDGLARVPRDAVFFATGAFGAGFVIDMVATLGRMVDGKRWFDWVRDRVNKRFETALGDRGLIAAVQRAVDKVVFGGRGRHR